MRKHIAVAVDQGVDLKKLRQLQRRGVIVLHQVHNLEQTFPFVRQQGKAFTLNVSHLSGPDMLADERFNQALGVIGRANSTDSHHLYAAYLNRHEYFITENPKDFIEEAKRFRLEGLLGVKIRQTHEFIRELEGLGLIEPA